MLIADYNPGLLSGGGLYENWLKQCEANAIKANVPLRRWLDAPPVFLFSK